MTTATATETGWQTFARLWNPKYDIFAATTGIWYDGTTARPSGNFVKTHVFRAWVARPIALAARATIDWVADDAGSRGLMVRHYVDRDGSFHITAEGSYEQLLAFTEGKP